MGIISDAIEYSAELSNEISKLTKHRNVYLCHRGSAAIRAAMKLIKARFGVGKLLIPYEGGWLTYEPDGKKLGFEIVFVKCNDGLLDLDDLREKASEEDVKAFLYTNPAGYFCNQDIEELFKVCKGQDCPVIMDATGGLGDSDLVDGNYADIIVGSFGKAKPVNAKYGGFLSFNDPLYYNDETMNVLQFDENNVKEVLDKFRDGPNRIQKLYSLCEQIKEELAEYNVLRRDRKGINVVVAFEDDEVKQKLIEYCEQKGLEFTEAPRYIRVQRKAISIEVKRVE